MNFDERLVDYLKNKNLNRVILTGSYALYLQGLSTTYADIDIIDLDRKGLEKIVSKVDVLPPSTNRPIIGELKSVGYINNIEVFVLNDISIFIGKINGYNSKNGKQKQNALRDYKKFNKDYLLDVLDSILLTPQTQSLYWNIQDFKKDIGWPFVSYTLEPWGAKIATN